jgi:hypothetical protein
MPQIEEREINCKKTVDFCRKEDTNQKLKLEYNLKFKKKMISSESFLPKE